MSGVQTLRDASSGYDWFRSSWNVVAMSGKNCSVWQTHNRRGECLFVRTQISGCRGHRGEQEMAHSGENGLYVTLYDAGSLSFRSDHRESALRAGDILLWDTEVAGSFDCEATASGRTILFPRSMVERRLGSSSNISGLHSDRSDPRTMLLRSHLVQLHQLSNDPRFDRLDDLLEASLELTFLCLSGSGRDPGGKRTHATFEAIRKYVRDHVGTSGLTPALLADQLGMSCRTLQTVLTSHGTTFTALQSGERMKRAAQLLRSEPHAPISEIALSLGFYDQAHFSNAFRRHYNMTPRQYRTRH